jgi:hypothetical protein
MISELLAVDKILELTTAAIGAASVIKILVFTSFVFYNSIDFILFKSVAPKLDIVPASN